MTDTYGLTTDPPLPVSGRGGRWLFPFLLALETAGAMMLYWEGLPIYRQTLANTVTFPTKTTAMALAGVALIQAAYWLRHRMRPEPPRYAHALLAHIVLFLARMVFLLPTAVFSFLFLTKTLEVQIPYTKYAFIILALFSLFCYVRELEWLGTHMMSREEKDRRPN